MMRWPGENENTKPVFCLNRKAHRYTVLGQVWMNTLEAHRQPKFHEYLQR